MQTFDVRRIRSNLEDSYAWVSLWFRGDGRQLEPLHIVCQREAQGGRLSKFDTVYLERNDQAVACYGGAKQIVVGEGSIEVRLNRAGVKALGLSPSFVLAVPEGLAGWQKARRVFRDMTAYPTGRAIKVAERGAAADGGGMYRGKGTS
ncbi:MAG TPA: hypothetical protein VJ739_03760 [Gemmataceae bacterium]|nr:hypothetical protein [Gemmataceae bacterium]